MNKPPTIHVPHGYIAFGKSTLAKKLAESLPAVLMGADDWYGLLYGRNEVDPEWDARIKKIVSLVREQTRQIIKTGGDVVIDSGYWSKHARAELAKFAVGIGANLIFYEINLDMDIARQRMLERNKKNPEQFVGEDYFDMNVGQFSYISEDENIQVVKCPIHWITDSNWLKALEIQGRVRT